ncbi:AAA family ATPase [Nonomuraea sp. NPDC049269]|uniref:helix-turn-helix transcriptional regulator n=1 Tax=Nonomuraea sp. NPDC049269 TaxID=3364349 RepID=UPI00371D7BC1
MRGMVVSPVFVGRHEELATLASELSKVQTGRACFVLVGGEAGIGKTRLVDEATRLAETSGLRALTGRCVELGPEGLPLAPLAEALRTLSRSASPEQVDAWLGPARGPLAHVLPSLEPIPGTAADQGAHLPELVLGMIERLSADRPLMLVLEDLHWADQSTLNLLTYLIRTLREAPVLMVGTYRSDEIHRRHPLRPLLSGWERMRQARRLELVRFRRDEVAAQVAAILGRPADPGTLDLVLDRSEGNAFLVEEMVEVVRDGGGDAAGLSPTLRDLLLIRAEARSAAAQRLLRATSAAGRQVPERLLAAVAGGEPAALFEALRELVENHLLLVDEGGQGYAFRHALARDAVYHDMLPGERAGWHVAYAQALSSNPDLAADQAGAPAALAHHWLAALDLPAALPALLAAAKTSAMYAPAEQLTHLERALEIWPRVPDAAALTGTDLIEVLTEAGDAAYRAGSVDRSRSLVGQALAELGENGSVSRRALLMWRRGRTLLDLGQHDESISILRAALDLLPAEPLEYAHAALLTPLAATYMRDGSMQEAATVAERAVAVATAVGAHTEQAEALITLGWVRAFLGEAEAGIATLMDGLRLAEQIGAVETAMRGWTNSSDALEMFGRHQEAIDSANAGLELARRTGSVRTHGAYLAGNMIESMVHLGHWQEARRAIAQALRSEPEGLFSAALLERAAQIAVLSGRGEEAARIAGQARAMVIDSNEPQFLHPLAGDLAEAQRLAGDLDAALATITEALRHPGHAHLARFSLPLIWLGTRIGIDRAILARDRRKAGPSDEIVEQLVAMVGDFPVITPADQGYALMIAAEQTRLPTAGPPSSQEWHGAVTAWRAADEPYMLAYCLFRLAERQCATSDRGEAVRAAAEASRLAARLGAEPLSAEIDALARRARLVLSDEVSEEPAPTSPDPMAQFGLTEREREVLGLLAAGRSNSQIAAELFISPKTASVHVSNILAKLGVTGRVEAAALVHRLAPSHPALIPPGPRPGR